MVPVTADRSSPSRPLRAGPLPFAVAGALLAALWVVFSGKFDPLHLAYGVLSVAVVLWLNRHLVRAPCSEGRTKLLTRVHWPRAIVFPLWLLKEIALANVQVARTIVRPNLDLDPVILRFRYPVDCRVTKAVLGNSITLTPGTFTVRVRGDWFVVHALDLRLAGSILDGTMPRRVAAMFGIAIEKPDVEIRRSFAPEDGDIRPGDEFVASDFGRGGSR